MTVAELVAELSKWPGHAEVYVTKVILHPPGSAVPHSIVDVTGAAGSRIDSSDSCVMVNWK